MCVCSVWIVHTCTLKCRYTYMTAYMQRLKKDAKCPALPLPGSFLCDRYLTEHRAGLAASKLQQYLQFRPQGTCNHT